jgi:grpE
MFFKKRNMSSDKNYKDKKYDAENLAEGAETMDVDPTEDVQPDAAEVAADEEVSEIETLKNLLQTKEEEVEKEKKEYLFLMAEFDNFRKRTLRERTELVKNASEKALQGLLPIVDDFERGLDAIRDSSDAEAVKEGMNLIYNKLIKYLADNGVKAIESTGADFDTELHEAVAMVPADDETPKGKVKDTVSKGYTINDKVLRHAKVVVAQ